MIKLNLGCERDIKEGYINLDNRYFPGVDKIHDLNQFPYPFEPNSVGHIRSENCFEQLDNCYKVFKELYRICKNEATVNIIVYHYSSCMAYYYLHKTFFNSTSIQGLRKDFEILNVRITVSENKTLLVKILEYFINKNVLLYEKTFLSKLFPAYRLHFKLKAIK